VLRDTLVIRARRGGSLRVVFRKSHTDIYRARSHRDMRNVRPCSSRNENVVVVSEAPSRSEEAFRQVVPHQPQANAPSAARDDNNDHTQRNPRHRDRDRPRDRWELKALGFDIAKHLDEQADGASYTAYK
jgi:hypothetical protein